MSLELSSKDTYEEVSRQLAAALSPPLEEPLKLRFTQQNNYTQQPKPQPMRFPTQEQDLPDMLHHFGQVSDTLFYEVLDLPLPELERLKTLKVTLSCKRCPCFLLLEGSCSKLPVQLQQVCIMSFSERYKSSAICSMCVSTTVVWMCSSLLVMPKTTLQSG